jgi:hypothetical protein
MIDVINAPSLRVAAHLGFAEFARGVYKGHSVSLLERLARR